ncbi:hypothetical protein P7C71_g2463, partial [Lecanoromycetidae sp. Uapishka_2]
MQNNDKYSQVNQSLHSNEQYNLNNSKHIDHRETYNKLKYTRILRCLFNFLFKCSNTIRDLLRSLIIDDGIFRSLRNSNQEFRQKGSRLQRPNPD